MKTTKYRLLKDLPGCGAGLVFGPLNYGPYTKERHVGGLMYAPDGTDHDETEINVPLSYIKSHPSWFEEIPEQPYPWTPGPSDFFDFVRAACSVGQMHASSGGADEMLAVGNVWRSRHATERVALAQKVLYKAMHALFNRDASGWKPGSQAYWIPELKDSSWMPSEIATFTGERMGDEWPDEESCRAECAIRNMFVARNASAR